jgi:CheY-like chemotaxis protein
METPLKKILLVEDEDFDADLIVRSLKKIPLANEVVRLEDGAELLDYLQVHPVEEIAVILLDLKMPKVSGIEALRVIRADESWRKLPVVILTSDQDCPELDAAYELGVNAYVPKPVDPMEFSEAMKTLGMFWALINVPGK